MAANICAAVSQSTLLCSMSTVSQAKPARARKRAAVMLPSDNQVPTEGRPSSNARFTALARMPLSPLTRSEELHQVALYRWTWPRHTAHERQSCRIGFQPVRFHTDRLEAYPTNPGARRGLSSASSRSRMRKVQQTLLGEPMLDSVQDSNR